MELVKATPSYFYMVTEDWQGAEIFEVELWLEPFVYWPFGGHA